MAPLLRNQKYLECFYCGKRSNRKYDGFMTKWECTNCDSTNFLDKNGEYIDPPVATDLPAPSTLSFAIPRPNSPPSYLNSNPNLLCATCQKNQHLYASSLAQYDVPIDTRDPNYRQKEKEYYAWRKRLEKTYPQVCAGCEAKVQDRIKETATIAKSDHLRRMMGRSRERRGQKKTPISVAGVLATAGKTLWYMGLYGQLSWSVSTLLAVALHSRTNLTDTVLKSAGGWAAVVISLATSKVWIRYSLVCSILSFWWNPMFYNMKTGFVNHIVGFGEWYKLQVLMIISRSIFHSITGTGVLADPYSQASIGAHVVMIFYIVFLAHRSKRSLRIDTTPLWQSGPSQIGNVGPKARAPSPVRDSNDLGDILDSIAATPARRHVPGIDSTSPLINGMNLNRTVPNFQTPNRNLVRKIPLALDESPSFSGGRSNLQNVSDGFNSDVLAQYSKGDEMDWEQQPQLPSPPRAFRPVDSFGGQTGQSFNHAPASEESNVFWFKNLPPAPKTPAEKLWNPPQNPQLQKRTPETKDVFFNTLTKRNLAMNSKTEEKPQMELRQPKFFAPSMKSEVGGSLANMLSSFTLDTLDEDDEGATTNIAVENRLRFRWDHLAQCFVLLIGLWFWNHVFKDNLNQDSTRLLIGVLFGGAGIGARTAISNLISEQGRTGPASKVLGVLLGVLECSAAFYGIIETLGGRADRENFSSMGTILLGGMLVQEFWYASFG